MIDDEATAKINQLTNQNLKQILEAAFDANRHSNVLWHYTRPPAFLQIVEKKTLRGSHIRFMNDSREYIHATHLALDALARAKLTLTSQHAKTCLEAFETNLNEGLQIGMGQAVFVASLSGARDDLSQWRAYGGSEGGISLGFDFNKLMGMSIKPSSTVYLLPVEYDATRQREIATRVVEGGVGLYEQLAAAPLQSGAAPIDPAEYAFAFMKQASLVGSITKDSAFHGENEWRLLTILEEADLPQVDFVAKETLIVPTFDFKLGHPKLNGRLPLVEVLVGPGRMSDHSAEAIKALLRKADYPVSPVMTHGQTVQVQASEIPYRVVS